MGQNNDDKTPPGEGNPPADNDQPKDDKTPPAEPPGVDAATQKELDELRAYKRQSESAKADAETERLKQKGDYEKLSQQQAQQLAQRTAEFRSELLQRDIRSHVLEHLDPEHRKKVDLVIPSVAGKLGEVEWDGLSLKTNVGKAAKEVVDALGLAVAPDQQKRTAAPPSRSSSDDRQRERPNNQNDRPLTPRELAAQGVADAFAKRAGT
jgi:diadenosine tetraphosphate (Ap4A) HIT family hydrolase